MEKKIKIKNSLIFFIFIFINSALTSPLADLEHLLNTNYDLSCIKILGTIKKGKTVVTFLEDEKGNKFCVRQITRTTDSAEFGFVREVIASYVAESANIPVTSVRIIPKNLPFPGKKFQERLGTLQNCALGESKHTIALHLEQRMKSTDAEKEKGLTRHVIKQMALHPDLPKIVAFDTFVSNPDRSDNNVFYNAITDHFCGIDLELAFKLPTKRDLGYYACLRILEMIVKKTILSQKELQALQVYTKTLKKLFDKNEPRQLYKNLAHVSLQAGYCANAKEVDKKFEGYKDKISRQYASIKILLELLDLFIKSHTY